MFKIEIVELVEVEKPHEVEYKKRHDGPDEEGHPQYGYVQAPGKRLVREEVLRLSQTVNGMDLVAVIKAVNGIPG